MTDSTLTAAQDEYAMRLALDQALNAQLAGEVPVGAVIMRVVDGVPQVLVTVELQRDAETGGYAWTDPAGQSARISSETLCQGNIIVDEKRPVALLLPR